MVYFLDCPGLLDEKKSDARARGRLERESDPHLVLVGMDFSTLSQTASSSFLGCSRPFSLLSDDRGTVGEDAALNSQSQVWSERKNIAQTHGLQYTSHSSLRFSLYICIAFFLALEVCEEQGKKRVWREEDADTGTELRIFQIM